MISFLYKLYVWNRVFYHKFILRHNIVEELKETHWRDMINLFDYTCSTENKFLGRITV